MPEAFTTRPELRGTYGMVAASHWLAASVGMAVLERGGNAFDAAVAAGFMLQVVTPHFDGPAGEVPILLWSAHEQRVLVVNGQGPAPKKATIDFFRDRGYATIPGTGALAACVPGAFGAWMVLLRDFGRLHLRDVLQFAIDYAESGFPIGAWAAEFIAANRETFLHHWPGSAALYLRPDVPSADAILDNPALAATYRRVLDTAEAAAGGREAEINAALAAWYEGFVAEEIDRYLEQHGAVDARGTHEPALLTADDMAGWRPDIDTPVSLDYHEFTVFKTRPWGQGPVFLQQLALLRRFDLTAMGHLSADFIHTVVEAAKLAFADREAWYGDPRFVDVPLTALLSEDYAAERRGLIGPAASRELRPGSPAGRTPRIAWGQTIDPRQVGRASTEPVPGSMQRSTHGDTAHIAVADREGNLVSAMPSGGWLQGSPVIPSLGFPLGTRAQMFSLDPTVPNALAPGKRPRTTLSPGLAFRDGAPYLAFGTPGGDRQDQWALLFFLAHARFGLNLQAAADAPTFYTTHFPASFEPHLAEPAVIIVEDRVPAAVVAELRARGHVIRLVDGWSLGWTTAAGRDPRNGWLMAAANPRHMRDYAVGR